MLCVCVGCRAKGSGSYRESMGGYHLELKYFTHCYTNCTPSQVPWQHRNSHYLILHLLCKQTVYLFHTSLINQIPPVHSTGGHKVEECFVGLNSKDTNWSQSASLLSPLDDLHVSSNSSTTLQNTASWKSPACHDWWQCLTSRSCKCTYIL